MKIKLSSKAYGDFFAFIDDEDYDLIKNITWNVFFGKNGVKYARGRVKDCDRQKYGQTLVRMHRVIMSASDDQLVDHIDHDGLNNRRSNLRIVTQAQNSMNMRTRNTVGFKGVAFVKKKKLYKARIRVNNVLIQGGMFKNKFKAALAYNELAKKYFGEYACLNKLTDDEILLSETQEPLAIYNTNKTGYRGVSISKATPNKKYVATIKVGKSNKYLGCFDSAVSAAKAYNEAVLKYDKPISFLNKIDN